MPTDLLRLVRQQRAALAKTDAANLERIADAYALMYDRLSGDIEALTLAIEAMESPSIAMVKKLSQYKELMRKADRELTRFTSYLETVIDRASFDAIRSGLSDSAALVKAAGIAGQFQGIAPNAMREALRFLSEDGPLYARLKLLTGSTVDKISQTIFEGIGAGYNPRKIAALIQDAFGGGLTDALRNTRTVQIYSYRESARGNYIASGVVDKWIWWAELDADTCEACIAEHGSIHDMDETLDGHYNCVLPDTIVTSTSLPSALITRHYKGQAVRIKTFSGKFLSVTPNHPILTGRGWVAAKNLVLGDNVIRHGWNNGTSTGVDPNKNHSPATIEDIFLSLKVDGFSSVPSSPKDFHGDGGQSEINIVRPASELRSKFFSAFGEPLFQEFFSGRDFEIIGLTPESQFDKSGGISWIPANRVVGGSGIPGILLGRALGHREPVSIGATSRFDIVDDQDLVDYATRYIETLSDKVFTFSPFVSPDNFLSGKLIPDRIVGIDVFIFDGHVYNLETKDGWYISNSIITHNCRCAPLPYIEGLTETPERGQDWFNNLSEAEQRGVMGDTKYDAYKEGKFQFGDMVRRNENEVYGQMVGVVPLKDLIGE